MNDFRRRVLIGAGVGGGGGALLGAANALKDHGLDTTTEDVLEQMWNKGSVGALGGAGVGALGHLIYEAKRNVKPPIAEKLDLNKINFNKAPPQAPPQLPPQAPDVIDKLQESVENLLGHKLPELPENVLDKTDWTF